MPQPGQLGLNVSPSPTGGAYNDYTQAAYQQGPLSDIALHRQLAAQEDPHEVRRLLNEAKSYLHEGTRNLSDIGTSNGLNAAQWTALGSLVGASNPMEGVQGWMAPKNQVHEAIQQQAQAAILQNEFNKQRATAALQYGSPLATNQAAQDVVNYNQPGIINAMPNPDVASLIQQRQIHNQIELANQALRARENAYRTGAPLYTQQIQAQGPGGEQYAAEVGGIQPSSFIQGNVPLDQQPVNYQNAAAQSQKYAKLAAQYNPEYVQTTLGNFDKALDQIATADTQGLPGGVKTYDHDTGLDAIRKQNIPVDQITSGEVQRLLGKGGVMTPGAQALASLAGLSQIPGFEKPAQAAMQSLIQNGTMDIPQLKAGIGSANENYKQEARVAPIMQHVLNKNQSAWGNMNSDQLKAEAQQRGYNTPFGDNPEVNNNMADTLSAAGAGIVAPKFLEDNKGKGQGYASDYVRYVNSQKGGTQKAIDNLTSKYIQNGMGRKDAEMEARTLWGALSRNNTGGLYGK